ncbi:hypothetical protein G6685_08940 [Polynucleobacter paneuropaeus]|jgi:hypothetical protein|nr:hypothetical protein [Polynucleobacter paneuropaeus]
MKLYCKILILIKDWLIFALEVLIRVLEQNCKDFEATFSINGANVKLYGTINFDSSDLQKRAIKELSSEKKVIKSRLYAFAKKILSAAGFDDGLKK